jgi:hypothetical protein
MAITREKSTGEVYSGDRFQKRREREETVEVMMLTGGAQCQRAREEQRDTASGFLPRLRADSDTGPNRSLRPLFIFILFSPFSFSVFLISFIDFAKKLQFNSNHFQKFCKIHCKVLNQ